MSRRDRLQALEARIERIATEPQSVEVGWIALAKPFLRLIGWQPKYETAGLSTLVDAVLRRETLEEGALERNLEAAIVELEGDVQRAERAAYLNGTLPTAHLAWLGRMVRTTTRIDEALRERGDRALSAIDPVLVAPPLAIAAEELKPSKEKKPDDASAFDRDAGQARIVELQLAAVDHIIEAAREETSFLSRRRSLLEAARRLLLDADASLPLAPDGVKVRKRYLAEQIVQIDRAEAAGVNPRVGLLHQARSALSRGERERLFATLAALETTSLTAGDAMLGERVDEAIGMLAGKADTTSDDARRRSLRRSVDQAFGEHVTDQIETVFRERLVKRRNRLAKELADHEDGSVELALAYLEPKREREAVSALLSVDGCFDVGAPLVPTRVRQEQIVARLVRHPTQNLVLTRARTPDDLTTAVVSDPRSVLLDLATGRLLARRFVDYEKRVREHTEMVGEARVYLLDGSTSMLDHGREMARARMRDAILVAELSTMMERLQNADRHTRVVLFYRYFTKRIEPVTRIGTADDALAAIGSVLATPRRGGTDIEGALAACFETIRAARGADPELARAQVVLITDGKAMVRDQVVAKARAPVNDMSIAVSVIALGEENPALRRLVAQQRAEGDRAFYHFLDDDTLAELCAGNVTLSRALHLPDRSRDTPESLAEELGRTLDDLADLERLRHGAVLRATEEGEELVAALDELGLGERALSEGQRARREAAARDRRAVEERFEAWFPSTPEAPLSTTVDRDDVDSTLVALGTVAEVVGEMGAEPLVRQADAVDILERLLPDARLTPAAYDAVIRAGIEPVEDAIAAVRAAAKEE